jgi:type IV secretion system protein VirD4
MTGDRRYQRARDRSRERLVREFYRLFEHLRRAGRRTPALARKAGRRLADVPEAFKALVVVVAIPVALSVAASERWSTLTSAAMQRLLRKRVLGVIFLAFLLGALLPDSTVSWLLRLPGVWVLAALLARAVYPHTLRGRVRRGCGLAGWSGWWDLRRHASAHAARRAAVASRPALATPIHQCTSSSTAALFIERLPISECGTWLGRSTVGPVIGTECYAPYRDVVGLIAPPQSGKTALIGHHVIDHPGAVVTTSSKPDVYGYTAALRGRRAASRRVELFNPERLAGLSSTFRWSPVAGCEHPAVAAERAAALVGATSAAGGEDGTFWLDSSSKVLRCLLMAAALDNRTMGEVAMWVTNPSSLGGEALTLLEQVHDRYVPEGWAAELRQVLQTDAKRTRESIFLTLSQSVAFMSDPDVAAICTPMPSDPVFDVASFLADIGTLYVLGSDRPHANVAPLLAALTSYVFETAKRLASSKPAGRLDPPLLLALDEAALITPVPLDRWVADAGGRGIHIVWVVQSASQLAQRWGRDGANTIWNATNAKLVYGGLTVEADLTAISRLCGERYEVVFDGQWGQRLERMAVLPVDKLRTLPMWHALLLHRVMPPTVVRLKPFWERRDVRRFGAPPTVPPISSVFPQAEAADSPTVPISPPNAPR